MGVDETTQVSRVRTHVLAMKASLNTLDIRLFIATSTSKYALYERTVSYGYVMTLIMILSP